MGLGNIWYLEEHGPVPADDLPFDLKNRQRQEGLCIMKLRSSRGRGEQSIGETDRIAYLDDEHDPETVVRAFIDTNPSITDNKSRRGLTSLFGNHGQAWSDAASEVLDDYYESGRGEAGTCREAGETEECSFCGQEVLKGRLPTHLTECPET